MSTLLMVSFTFLWGCEKPERCTVNVECGTDHLCRDGACKPKCLTYRTCEEGEACVDGACEVPTADYCSHVVPAQTPPEMGPYEPCPPGEMSVPVDELTGGAVMAGESEMMSMGGESSPAPAEAGEPAAGETTPAPAPEMAGANSAGEAAGEEAAGEEAAGEEAAGEETAGEVIEVVGGQTE